MADYKYKIGDRLRNTGNGFCTAWQVNNPEGRLTVKSRHRHPVHGNWYGGYEADDDGYETGLDLAIKPQYTPIIPKVGDKFCVVKGWKGSAGNLFVQHAVISIVSEQTGFPKAKFRFKTAFSDSLGIEDKYLTTEYLEPVVEKRHISVPKCYMDELIVPIIPAQKGREFKQQITKTIMNRIKTALLSKADKTLIKAGFLDDNLNLTGTGEEAMQFIAFEANKKTLVEMAEADIKEVEDIK